MTTTTLPRAAARPRPLTFAALAAARRAARVLTRMLDRLQQRWRLAVERSQFERLDAHVLRDLGVGPQDFESFCIEARRREADAGRRRLAQWRETGA